MLPWKITLEKPKNLQLVVECLFKLLKKYWGKKFTLQTPNFFNTDESWINMDVRPDKVMVSCRAHSPSTGSPDHIIVNCAVSAAGTALLRLSLRKPFNSLHIQGPINALYAKSPNSYMDEELFYNWLSKHVIVLQTYHLSKEYW